MKLRSAILGLLCLILSGLIFYKCSSHKVDVKIDSDKTLLKKFVNLPVEPDSVKWIYEPVTRKAGGSFDIGPTDYEFIAILYFNNRTIDTFRKDFDSKPPIVNRIYVDDLYPYFNDSAHHAEDFHYFIYSKVVEGDIIKYYRVSAGYYTLIGNVLVYANM